MNNNGMTIDWFKAYQEEKANYSRKLKDALYWMRRAVDAENKLAEIAAVTGRGK